MPHGPDIPFLREILVFLIAAVLLVPLFQRFKVSPVLGYLTVGVLVGPHGFAVVHDVEGVHVLAELGIVFLMFTIGLELSLERLLAMRRFVFGLGGSQVLVCGLVIGLIAWAWGNAPAAAVVIGACLALSSTAIVVQLLVERGEIATRVGRVCFSILLFQDLAVVPILFLVGVLSPGSEGSIAAALGLALLRAAAAILVILVLGRLLLRRLFQLVAGAHSPELFTAMILLAVLVTALGTLWAGMSMALGAFLAGLLLAETEFRHQVETDIAPFKGLLLGLFFISVGMALDLAAVADLALWVGLSVIGLIAIKAALISGLCLLFGLPRHQAIHVGLLLGQGGEFAFVVIGTALLLGLMPRETGQFMLIVAGLTMMMTPLLATLGRRAETLLEARDATRQLGVAEDEIGDLDGHIVIAGFGRVGQTVARLLELQKQPYVALDLDTGRLKQCRRMGLPVFYGDASRKEMLEKVGAGRAAAAVVTLDRPAAAARAVESLHQSWPEMPIYARARDAEHAERLTALGASDVMPETVESSLQLAGQVLHVLGTSSEAVHQMIEQIRNTRYAELDLLVEAERKQT